ncbi:hypothetical protein [Nostoc favosum]|nr:hypothetical protein [Nostoc favosum]
MHYFSLDTPLGVNSDRIPILNSLIAKLRKNTADKLFSAESHRRKLI